MEKKGKNGMEKMQKGNDCSWNWEEEKKKKTAASFPSPLSLSAHISISKSASMWDLHYDFHYQKYILNVS